MKILQLSDLHIVKMSNDAFIFNPILQRITDIINEENPDVVVITGDIFESCVYKGMHEFLGKLFGDRKVICTLGNHEFFYRTVEETHKIYKDDYNPDKYDVHYLDVVDYVDVENLRFLGNVLWYDGSLSTIEGQDLSDYGGWMDRTIRDFDPKKECFNAIKPIRRSITNDKINVLCTHCVPTGIMNGHMSKLDSRYNAFSGVEVLEDLDVLYSFSGHTHWKREYVYEKLNNNVHCYNCGSDYGLIKNFIVYI